MDFSRSAREVFNRLRGFQPWPGAFTTFKGKTLHVHRAQPRQHAVKLTPGEIAVEELIAEEDMVVTMSHAGYVKRNAVSAYRSQKRRQMGWRVVFNLLGVLIFLGVWEAVPRLVPWINTVLFPPPSKVVDTLWPMILSGLKTWLETGELLTTPGSLMYT